MPQSHHDWHSHPYVEGWIRKDRAREGIRRPILRRMLAHAGLDPRAPLAIIDIGAGYGAVSAEVLAAFPAAHVTLQDYSPVMLDAARRNLVAYAGRAAFAQGDLAEPDWTETLDAPFDLALSAIAIHNLEDTSAIAACYRAVRGILQARRLVPELRPRAAYGRQRGQSGRA